MRDDGHVLALSWRRFMTVELGDQAVEALEQRLELAVGELVAPSIVRPPSLPESEPSRASGPSRTSSRSSAPGPGLERLDPAGGAEMRDGDPRQLVGRVGEHADPHAVRLQPAQRRGRRCARAQVDGRVILGEPLEQDTPVRQLLVEVGRVDVGAARDVREPRVVERPRVPQDGIELDRHRRHPLDPSSLR